MIGVCLYWSLNHTSLPLFYSQIQIYYHTSTVAHYTPYNRRTQEGRKPFPNLKYLFYSLTSQFKTYSKSHNWCTLCFTSSRPHLLIYKAQPGWSTRWDYHTKTPRIVIARVSGLRRRPAVVNCSVTLPRASPIKRAFFSHLKMLP